MAIVIALSGLPVESAFAVTAADLFAEAEAIMERIDALQTDVNNAQAEYDQALEENKTATKAMNQAEARKSAAEARIAELQGRLAERANSMYKNGPIAFIEVLFGVSSFDEFLTSWDMIEKIGAHDASLVQETKDMRAEAEAARQEYSEHKEVAAAKMAKAEEMREQIRATQAALREEAEKVTAEAIELWVQEELEAEAAVQAAAAAEAMRKQLTFGLGTLRHPCPGNTGISSPFGWRTFDNSFHKGCDFAAYEGTPIYAAEQGTVIAVTSDGGFNGGAGNWVVISHGNGLVTKYMHASKVYVSKGEKVEQGKAIAAVGNTGNSFGPHLHFQVEYLGIAIDPFWLL